MSGCELYCEVRAHAVEDVQNGSFEGFEIGTGSGPQPLVFDFAPERLNFIEVGTVCGYVENMHVVGFPRWQPRLECGRVVQAGIFEDQHGRTDTGGHSGVEHIDDESGVARAFAGGGVNELVVALNKPNTLKVWLWRDWVATCSPGNCQP